MNPPRVLVIAEHCNPEWVSIPLEGWSHSRAIAAAMPAHLVTQVRNRDAIVRAGLVEGLDFTAIDSEFVARKVATLRRLLAGGKGGNWTTVTALLTISYWYFERLVWKQFGPRLKAGEFDVVHRVNPVSPTVPSWLAKKCRGVVPFVMGPINGGVPWPKGFDHTRRQEREWLSYVRDAYKLVPGYRATRRHASAILVGSKDTWEQMPAKYRGRCFYVPENAIEPARFTARRTRKATLPLRVAFVGRLVPYKGADMLLDAAEPLLKDGSVRLEIIGDGPQMPLLREKVRTMQLADSVTLAGWVPHQQLQDRLAGADLFAFPSIREFGGAVVLEAMAVGVVPVVMDYGGPAELATDKTGFRIPMGPRARIVENLREILASLVADPSPIDVKSTAAVRRAHEQFSWDAKVRQVRAVYDWTRDPSSPKPSWPIPLPDLRD